MKKKLFALFLCLVLAGSLSAQIKPKWIKAGQINQIIQFKYELLLKELSGAPTHTSGYGSLYVLSSDGALYYKDDAGSATDLTSTSDAFTVKIDAAATAGYLGAAYNDGVLRSGTGLTYTDGGNYVTLTVTEADIESMIDTLDNLGSIGASLSAPLDINTNVIQDINFWDTIASGNPALNLFGWNTAGGDRESFSLSMSDTNDVALLTIPNSANNEGFMVSLGETNQKFSVLQNSDTWSIQLDGSDVIYHTTDGQHIFSTDEAAAAAETRWNDADDSAYVGIDSPATVTGSWTFTLPAAVPGAASVFNVDTSGDTTWTAISTLGGAANVTDIANGARITGVAETIIDLYDGTNSHFIEASSAEGLTATGLRIVLDEQSNNMVPIVICGETERDKDYGYSVNSNPKLFITAGDGQIRALELVNNDIHFNIGGATADFRASTHLDIHAGNTVEITHSADIAAGDWLTIGSTGDSLELTDANGQQSLIYLGSRVAQSGTAAFDGLLVDTLEQVFGDGTTGDGNNLIRAASLGNTAFQIEVPGPDEVATANGSDESLIYVHTTTLFDASATTDSVTICTIPANSMIFHISMTLNTQFAGGTLSDVDITIGEGTDVDGFMVKAMNLMSDSAGTVYATRGDLWNTDKGAGTYYIDAAETIVATATATGDDLDQTSAGSVTFTVAYMCFDKKI